MSNLRWQRAADGSMYLSVGTSGSVYPVDDAGRRLPVEEPLDYDPNDSSDFIMDDESDGMDDDLQLHEPMTIAHSHDGLATHYHDDDNDHSGVEDDPEVQAPDSAYADEYEKLRAQAEDVPRPSSGYVAPGLGGRKMVEDTPRRRRMLREAARKSEASLDELIESDYSSRLDEQSDRLEHAARHLARARGVRIEKLSADQKLRLYSAASKWLPGYGHGGRES